MRNEAAIRKWSFCIPVFTSLECSRSYNPVLGSFWWWSPPLNSGLICEQCFAGTRGWKVSVNLCHFSCGWANNLDIHLRREKLYSFIKKWQRDWWDAYNPSAYSEDWGLRFRGWFRVWADIPELGMTTLKSGIIVHLDELHASSPFVTPSVSACVGLVILHFPCQFSFYFTVYHPGVC
jgi:hypothetical protein